MRFAYDDLENPRGMHAPRQASRLGKDGRGHFAQFCAFEAPWDFIKAETLLMSRIKSRV
jgi:hypothetical protein